MRKYLAFVTILSLAAPAGATEWDVLGPRAMGMGGAGVAVPQGAESAYWNPAQLGLSDNPSGVQIPVGAHLGVSGSVLAGANDLHKVSQDCAGGGCTNSQIQNALSELNNPNNGVRGDVAAGAGLKMGRLALFANNLTAVGAKPVIDMADNTQGTVANNTSALRLRGINVTEFGAAYGHELPFARGLNAGLALKGMVGRVGFEDLNIVNNNTDNGGLGNFSKNTASSVQPGVDLGMLWDVSRSLESVPWHPRIGLAARNINNPRFTNSAAAVAAGLPSKYSIQGNARLGLAISPLHFWNIAADADLTRNLTAVEGVKSQVVGLGTEVNVFNRSWLNIPLRAGLSKNVADSSAKTSLAGGFGLNFLHFNIDVGVQTTPAQETIQTQDSDKKLPNELSVSAQLALLFGGQAPAEGPGLADTESKAKPKK